MRLYRFLSDHDTSDFCHRVSAGLDAGWELYGQPTRVIDAGRGVMRCGQAMTKVTPGDYDATMKLGEA